MFCSTCGYLLDAFDTECPRCVAAACKSFKDGGLPLQAVHRLRRDAARQGTHRACFTSNLSVSEFALAGQAGYQLLGQVMGCCVYHAAAPQFDRTSYRGIQAAGACWELTASTEAGSAARTLALSRLKQEATLLRATGVVGVRLRITGDSAMEVQAIGTAIRESEAASSEEVFLSAVTGQEFWLLRQGGYRPVGLVAGNCTFYQIPGHASRYYMTNSGGQGRGGLLANQQLDDFTDSLYECRALAMTRMEAEAGALDAIGIVATSLEIATQSIKMEEKNRSRTDMIYHATAIGTAIAAAGRPSPRFSIRACVSLGS